MEPLKELLKNNMRMSSGQYTEEDVKMEQYLRKGNLFVCGNGLRGHHKYVIFRSQLQTDYA